MPPAESRLAELHRLGQSPWFDYINRALIQRGGLKKMVDRDGLGGVTTNPAIFETSIGGGREYDEAILTLGKQGLDAAGILDRLVVDDVRAACDVLTPVYLATGGEDGFVDPAQHGPRLFEEVPSGRELHVLPGGERGHIRPARLCSLDATRARAASKGAS